MACAVSSFEARRRTARVTRTACDAVTLCDSERDSVDTRATQPAASAMLAPQEIAKLREEFCVTTRMLDGKKRPEALGPRLCPFQMGRLEKRCLLDGKRPSGHLDPN